MKYRKMRIAWSVGCGIVCTLLIVLWVRSYWRADNYTGALSLSQAFRLRSALGGIELVFMPLSSINPNWPRIWSAEYGPGARDLMTKNLTWGFRWFNNPPYTIIQVPDWLFVLMFSMAAAAPWFQCRFSLRNLLIATTLAAVGLSLAVYAIRTH